MKGIYDKVSEDCCKEITKKYSTSFSLGIYFLDKELRAPIYSIYAFVRLADEIVDSFHQHDKYLLLKNFKEDCFNAIDQKISLNPVLNAFQIVINRFNIEHSLINQFLLSMEMDLKPQVYTPELYDTYILGSAEVVGLMCLKVFVNGDLQKYEQFKPYAMALGSAFQKVNFLRDVKADHKVLKRCYFPNVDLNSFSDRQKKLIEQEIEIEFNTALTGIKMLPKSSRKGVYLAYIYYKRLFNKIKNSSSEKILNERIRVSNRNKLALMFLSLFKHKLGRI